MNEANLLHSNAFLMREKSMILKEGNNVNEQSIIPVFGWNISYDHPSRT